MCTLFSFGEMDVSYEHVGSVRLRYMEDKEV